MHFAPRGIPRASGRTSSGVAKFLSGGRCGFLRRAFPARRSGLGRSFRHPLCFRPGFSHAPRIPGLQLRAVCFLGLHFGSRWNRPPSVQRILLNATIFFRFDRQRTLFLPRNQYCCVDRKSLVSERLGRALDVAHHRIAWLSSFLDILPQRACIGPHLWSVAFVGLGSGPSRRARRSPAPQSLIAGVFLSKK